MKKKNTQKHYIVLIVVAVIFSCLAINVMFNPRYKTPSGKPWAPPIFMHGFLVFPQIMTCTREDGQLQYKIEYIRPLQIPLSGGRYADYAAVYIPVGSTIVIKGDSYLLEETTSHTQTEFSGAHRLQAAYPTNIKIQKFFQSSRINLAR